MGLFKCDKHGRASIVNLCTHLFSSFDSNMKPGKIVKIGLYDDFVGKIEEIARFSCCEACVGEYGLPKESGHLPWANFDFPSGSKGVCRGCFRDFLKAHGIAWEDFDLPDFDMMERGLEK